MSRLFVVPSWQGWASPARTKSAYQEFPQDTDAPVEPSTAVPHWVRLPFKPLGRNPYVQHQAQDESFVEPLDLPSIVRSIPFKGLGRNPYLWNTAQDFDAPPPPEAETLAPHIVRVPFRGLGHNPYLQHSAQDLSFVEPFDLPSVVRSVPYKPFGRNPYLHHTANDESFVEPLDLPSVVRIKPYPGLRGWNPYNWNNANDVVEALAEPETHAGLFVRLPFSSLLRSPYLRHAAQDESAPAPAEESTLSPHLVRLPLRPYSWVVPAYTTHSAQDPPISAKSYQYYRKRRR